LNVDFRNFHHAFPNSQEGKRKIVIFINL
jgi:hypothetical protein